MGTADRGHRQRQQHGKNNTCKRYALPQAASSRTPPGLGRFFWSVPRISLLRRLHPGLLSYPPSGRKCRVEPDETFQYGFWPRESAQWDLFIHQTRACNYPRLPVNPCSPFSFSLFPCCLVPSFPSCLSSIRYSLSLQAFTHSDPPGRLEVSGACASFLARWLSQPSADRYGRFAERVELHRVPGVT